MPATTLRTDEQIWAAFRTLGRVITQIPSTAASKPASSPGFEELGGSECPFKIASTRSACSGRHAAIVTRLLIPGRDAADIEEIQGFPERGEVRRIRRLIISSLLRVDRSWYSK